MKLKNIRTEQAVIGILLNGEIEEEVFMRLTTDHFTHPLLREIFKIIRFAFNEYGEVDIQFIIDELLKKKVEKAEEIILDLVSAAPSETFLDLYIDELNELRIKRELVELHSSLKTLVKDYKSDEILEYLANVVDRLNDTHESIVSIADIYPEVLKEVIAVAKGEVASGFPTGYSELDKILGGLKPSELYILAARPGIGKTSFALNIAANVSYHKPVLIFSLEMAREQLVQRFLAMTFDVHLSVLTHKRKATEEEIEILEQRFGEFAEIMQNIFIDDTPHQSLKKIKTLTRKYLRKYDIGLVVVDYLQLMHTRNRATRNEEVAELSRGFKLLAKEFRVPFLVLSQLSRKVEERTDKKPHLADLRDSGAIEQDADVVIFLHRPKFYSENQDPIQDVEVIIAKHRQGATGSVKLNFNLPYSRFEEVE